MSKPTPRKPLGLPPHRYYGHYKDKTGGRFVVLNTPGFALFRADAEGQPLDPESPLHRDENEFTAALGFGTFTRIFH